MPTLDMPDNELDNLFKKAVDSVDHPFREERWNAMEVRLNKWDRFNTWFWKILGGSVILLAIIAGILVATMPSGPSRSENQNFALQSEKAPGSVVRKPDPGTAANRTNPVDKEKTEIYRKEKPVDVAGSDRAPATQNRSNEIQTGTITSSGAFTNSGAESAVVTAGSLEDISEALIPNPDHLKIAELNTNPPGHFIGSPVKKQTPEPVAIVEPGTRKFKPSVWIDAIVGPDLSGIGIKGIGAGMSEGIGLEVNIVPRLTLSTGINHARKKYGVTGEYKSPFSSGSYNGPDPSSVNVACHVIDIPLNFDYSVFNSSKSSITLGTGLSSWLMMTEEYKFDYGSYYNPSMVSEYTIKNENHHYFGILNLSAGYTKHINDRWKWEIDPYLKLPLVDIAAAEIRLNSFGVLFSVGYRIK